MKPTSATEQEMPELAVFLHENLSEFQPFAYYDKHMDCIRVQIRDCSFYENRVNKYVTELFPLNEEDGSGLIGFNIKGVRYMIAELLNNEVHSNVPISIATFVDVMVKQIPEGTMKVFAEDIKSLTEELEGITIDLPMAA